VHAPAAQPSATFASHAAQVWPPVPHTVAVSAVTQAPAWQQPSGQLSASHTADTAVSVTFTFTSCPTSPFAWPVPWAITAPFASPSTRTVIVFPPTESGIRKRAVWPLWSALLPASPGRTLVGGGVVAPSSTVKRSWSGWIVPG
jgi:hypothetical protein